VNIFSAGSTLYPEQHVLLIYQLLIPFQLVGTTIVQKLVTKRTTIQDGISPYWVESGGQAPSHKAPSPQIEI